jgi:hypothetical protein
MKKTLLLSFVLEAAFSVSLAEGTMPAGLEPLRLTESEMDAVTAGATGVAVESVAVTSGANGYTYTRATTNAFSIPGNIGKIASGIGLAVACCGLKNEARVSTDAFAEGGIAVTLSHDEKASGPLYSAVSGAGFALSVCESGCRPDTALFSTRR